MKSIKNFCKQLLIAVACFFVMLSNLMIPVYADESGSCGENVTWKLKNGILTITGEGNMADYVDRYFPQWYTNRDEIIEVVIKDGVTSIGDVAFFDCSNLKKVTIANSVTSIGDYAFLQCDSLEVVKMSKNVKSIGDYAFKMCESLLAIQLYDGLQSIGYEAFFNCRSLSSVVVPSSVTSMDECVFSYCKNIKSAEVLANIKTLPEWTFYSCEALEVVTLSKYIERVSHYAFYDCKNLKRVISGASNDVRKDIQEDIEEDVPGIGDIEYVDPVVPDKPVDPVKPNDPDTPSNPDDPVTPDTPSDPSDPETPVDPEKPSDDPINPVTPGDDPVDPENPGDDVDDPIIVDDPTDSDIPYSFSITVIVDSAADWSSVVDKVKELIAMKKVLESTDTIRVTIKNYGNPYVVADVINTLAGHDAIVRAEGNNMYCEIAMKNLDSSKVYSDFELDYTMEEITNKSTIIYDIVGNSKAYYVNFKKSIDMPVTVMFPFGSSYNRNYASIYQKHFNSWDLLQSVQMDGYGVASFYLSNFDQLTSYMVALNVDGVDSSNSLVPENLYDDYGGLMDEYGNKYVITGYSSKWGISLKDFSIIVGVAFGAVVLLVGSTMFIIQRRKASLEKIRREVMSDDYLKNYAAKTIKKNTKKKKK